MMPMVFAHVGAVPEAVCSRGNQLAAPKKVIDIGRDRASKNIENQNEIHHAKHHTHQRRQNNKCEGADPAAGNNDAKPGFGDSRAGIGADQSM